METVCEGKEWDVALAYSKDGSVIGALPYLIGSKFGLRYIVQPQLTQYNGPWYRYPEELNIRKKLQFQYDVDEQLIEHLKKLKLAFFSQNFSADVTTWLPYHWAGYKQTTRYSYRYDDISNPSEVWSQIRRRDRQKTIESLMPQLEVIGDVSPNFFSSFYVNYWMQLGRKCLFTSEFVSRLCDTSISRGNGMLVGLKDKRTGILVGVTFAVYDAKCAYSLMAAFDRSDDAKGISECLFWAIMNQLSSRTVSFDFEGSMNRDIEYLYRSFGARPIAYHHIWKINNPLLRPFLDRRGI
jgi:hypothetical protein